jgi:ubiquinone/menaquinone biosynthesis C-methylase UbiE
MSIKINDVAHWLSIFKGQKNMDMEMKPHKVKARDFGLPDYFDMQSAIGHTKHVGGWESTQEIAEMCRLGSGQELLYVGSGAGVAAIKIAQTYGCKVVGVDLLETMVEAARRWAEERGATDLVEFRVGDAQSLPFPDEHFDVLLCESINTFVPDLDKAANEYARVVKSGGYVGLNEAVWYSTPPEQGEQMMLELTGQRLRRADEWIAMLKGAGLKDIQDRTYPVVMKAEMRSQFGFLSITDYLRILWRTMKSIFSDPSTREMLRLALREPRSAYDYMGYGLYVGTVP